MMLSFQDAYDSFLLHHTERRSGERLGRLVRGHAYAEKLFLKAVWWELFRHFDHLHPEYEIIDWRGRSYFADFVWIKNDIKIIIEIKGFSVHVRDMDRQKYCNELNRETFLTAMGFHVISFAYDDIHQRPDLSAMLMRMVMSRFQADSLPMTRAMTEEKEILRLAVNLARDIRVKDVAQHLNITSKTARLLLQKLCEKGLLRPCRTSDTLRVHRYELVPEAIKSL